MCAISSSRCLVGVRAIASRLASKTLDGNVSSYELRTCFGGEWLPQIGSVVDNRTRTQPQDRRHLPSILSFMMIKVLHDNIVRMRKPTMMSFIEY